MVESVDPVKSSALTVCTAPSSLHSTPEEQKGRGRRECLSLLGLELSCSSDEETET